MVKIESKEEILEKFTVECSMENEVDINIARKIIQGDLSHRTVDSEVKKSFESDFSQIFLPYNWFQCFLQCFFKKQGYFNKYNYPQKNFMLDHLSQTVPMDREKLREIIERCTYFKTFDDCGSAFEVRIIELLSNQLFIKTHSSSSNVLWQKPKLRTNFNPLLMLLMLKLLNFKQ